MKPAWVAQNLAANYRELNKVIDQARANLAGLGSNVGLASAIRETGSTPLSGARSTLPSSRLTLMTESAAAARRLGGRCDGRRPSWSSFGGAGHAGRVAEAGAVGLAYGIYKSAQLDDATSQMAFHAHLRGGQPREIACRSAGCFCGFRIFIRSRSRRIRMFSRLLSELPAAVSSRCHTS